MKAMSVILDSIKLFLRMPHLNDLGLSTITLLLNLFMASLDRCLAHCENNTDADWKKQIQDNLVDAGQLVKNLLKRLSDQKSYEQLLEFLNDLFKIVSSHEDLTQIWIASLYSSLQENIQWKIQRVYEDENLVKFYCDTDFSRCHPMIETVFSEAAFGVMEGSTGEDFLHRASHIQQLPYKAERYGKIFSHLLEKSLAHKDAMTLRYLLQWKPLAAFFKMLEYVI
ncbi:uncharacterized protein LOC117123867 [Anneissia japonica]|uniref:uncharacterized protein LOC117123867 n=1 Tax=Anneissia japonica TaxID=1529436 RepID=UPI0014259FE2|nr:uncharacterized protein LOC117123867 [Anneissia japonica]